MSEEIEPPFQITIMDDEPIEVKNPFSGRKATLTPVAVSVYDTIIGSELILTGAITVSRTKNQSDKNLIETIDKGKAWFIRHYPDEYMILLD